jgi:hypothetical protein
MGQSAAAAAAQKLVQPAPFRGRSWADYWKAVRQYRVAGEPDASVMVKRLSARKTAAADAVAHPDSGPLGTETSGPYYSASDTSLGYPNIELWSGAQRQTNCSLSQIIVGPQENAQYQTTYVAEQTTPNFEQYLHTISGLTSTVDKFANGCNDPNTYGQINKVVVAGRTSSGGYVSAYYSYNTTNTITVGTVDSSLANLHEITYTVGYNIAGIVAMDFNGDGYLDLAVLDSATDSYPSVPQISILISNGDGSYKAPVQLAADSAAFGVVAGDFNGDSKNDLVVTAQKSNGDYELLFYAGNGDGTFKAYTSTDTGTTERLVSLPVDVNKDGKLDILGWDIATSATTPTYTLASFINNGSATFTATESATAARFNPIAVGDLNGDGKIDAVIPDFGSNTFSIYQGNGSGGFTLVSTYPTIYGPDSAYITDFDGDGNADILIGIASNGFFGPDNEGVGEILLGKGSFAYSTPAPLQPTGSGVTFSNGELGVAVADLNGDSKQDAAAYGSKAGTSSNTVAVSTLLNNGSGGLAAGSSVNFSLLSSTPFLLAVPLSGTTPVDLVAAGTDPTTSAQAIQSAINNGTGTFTVKSTLLDLAAPLSWLAAGDFNQDSKNDLAFILNDNNTDAADGLYIALGNGDGTFQTPLLVDGNVNNGGEVFVADVNGDGKPDLIVSATGADLGPSTISVYLNQGTSFAAPVSFQTPDTAKISWILPMDFNGDGKIDLGLLGTVDYYDYNFYLYTGNKTATFTYSSTSFAGDNASSMASAVDVNHDGVLDLVLSGCCGDANPSVMLGKGGGAFYPPQVFSAPVSAASVLPIVLNNANYPDLLMNLDNYPAATLVPVLNHYANAPSVAKAATTVTLENPGTLSQGEAGYVGVTVTETSAAGIPAGTITLLNGTTVLQTASNYSGGEYYLNVPTNLTPGSYTYTVTYSGDNFNQPSTASVTFKVINSTAIAFTVSPNPIPYNATVTLKATVTRPLGTGYPTGSVEFFYEGGNAGIGSAPLVNGVATYTQSTAGLPAGLQVLQAGYYGDANDGDSLSSLVNVELVPKGETGTTTTLVFSPLPFTVGQTATLTATVTRASGTGTPTGTVTFYAITGGETYPLGPFTLNNKGQASTSVNTTGFNSTYVQVYAVYSGNSATQLYTSQSDTQEIFLRPPAYVYVSATPTTVAAGSTVTLTASVIGEGYGEPTGTVTFYGAGVKLGTATLNSNASASFTASTAGVPDGTYSVTATYSGDQYNGGATSYTPATVTVQ